LVKSGFTRLTFAVNHKASLLQAYCGDGSQWGVSIDYSLEDKPLSTIGPLTLIDDLPEDFLVMNGDVLCDLDFSEFYRAHVEKGNEVTVSSYQRSVPSDFGVIEIGEGGQICGFREKPEFHMDVSMGVYCINRSVVAALARGESYGFDNLMIDGIRDGMKIEAVPYQGYWLDIGRPDDYESANQQFAELKERWGL